MTNSNNSDNGSLMNYRTGDYLRPATAAELADSIEAGDEGVITVDGYDFPVFVQD